MIRFLLLTILPLILPFVAWYVWKVFRGEPPIDPQTGDQVPPDLEKAPRLKLFGAGVVLMILTVGIFLLVHDRTSEKPYQPIDVDKVIEQQEKERQQRNQTAPR